MAWVSLVKLPPDKCHWTILKIKVNIGSWASVFPHPCHHMRLMGPGELSEFLLVNPREWQPSATTTWDFPGELDRQNQFINGYIDGLVPGRRNSSVLAMELHLSCINPSISCTARFKHLITNLGNLKILKELNRLTHWGRDEMNNISQTTFSNVFSSMKMFEFQLKFHWSLFPRVQLTIYQHWFR